YFIEINNRQNSWEGNYSVQFKFDVLTHIDKEPNDTKENATNLVLNQENGGNLINRKNGDWDSHDFWKITIVEGGRLTIKDNMLVRKFPLFFVNSYHKTALIWDL
ncbi:MAG: hypothetical protein KAG91_02875, partial [Mycoplasmataceae bacterium]|nr:hypothetical protein [Mycoplasmataceae bacterium]